MAVLYLDGVQAPIAALAIIPAHRRPRLRSEFAFGLVAHLNFLSGLIAPDSELQIIDYIENALREQPASNLAFALETAHVSTDVSIVLASFLDQLSVAMLRWLCVNDSESDTASVEASLYVAEMPEHSLACPAH